MRYNWLADGFDQRRFAGDPRELAGEPFSRSLRTGLALSYLTAARFLRFDGASAGE